jgi:S-adenosylmethionine synthetase
LSRSSYIFTSESVSEGHPDKVADRISDTVVDAFLTVDPEARVACETLVTTNRIVLAGEVRAGKPGGDKAANKQLTKDILASLEPKVRAAIKDIGYEQKGFHWQKAKFANYLHGQSAHIAQGVDASDKKDEGAGDQGIMFGYASTETPELMPATLQYSHNILSRLAELRHSGELSELEPDAKSQVTLEYDGRRQAGPRRLDRRLAPAQEEDRRQGRDLQARAGPDQAAHPAGLPGRPDHQEDQWLVNPTGRFEIGGPDGDAGVTGRKIIVDTYGGAAPHGGGAFSGKDPTKVDRSAAYACRYLAKNVVAAGLAERCTIQIAYAIGVAQPVSFHVDLHGTGKVDPDRPGKDPAAADRRRHPARHPRAPAAEPPDLRPHRRLRPLRPHAGQRRRLLLGEDRPGGRAEGPGVSLTLRPIA